MTRCRPAGSSSSRRGGSRSSGKHGQPKGKRRAEKTRRIPPVRSGPQFKFCHTLIPTVSPASWVPHTESNTAAPRSCARHGSTAGDTAASSGAVERFLARQLACGATLTPAQAAAASRLGVPQGAADGRAGVAGAGVAAAGVAAAGRDRPAQIGQTNESCAGGRRVVPAEPTAINCGELLVERVRRCNHDDVQLCKRTAAELDGWRAQHLVLSDMLCSLSCPRACGLWVLSCLCCSALYVMCVCLQTPPIPLPPPPVSY